MPKVIKRQKKIVDLIEDFLEYCSYKNLSNKTIKKEEGDINQAKNRSKGNKTTKKTNNINHKNNYNDKPKIDKFNNFEQRNYDFERLEDLLLNGQGNLSECQI